MSRGYLVWTTRMIIFKIKILELLGRTREKWTGEGGCETCGHGAPEYYNTKEGLEALSWDNLEAKIDELTEKLAKEGRK